MHSLRRAVAVASDSGFAPTQAVGMVSQGTGAVPPPTTAMPSTQGPVFYEPPNENRVGMIIAVTVLLLLSIAGLVFAFIKVLNNDKSPAAATDIEVPNVIDMTQGDALAAILNRGFTTPPQIVEVTKDDKAPGLVFQQSPEAGKKAKANATFVLQISLGAESAFPPNVVGLTADDADKTLKDRGFGVQRVSQSSIDVPEGLVISQDPTPDRQLQKGKPVLIRISTGGQEFTLPANLVNQPIDQVQKTLTDLKLKVDQSRATSDTVDVDRVISTDPAPGSKIKEGARIAVVVSDGLPKVDMPNVVGLTQDAASSQLTSKGLLVQVDTTNLPPDDPNVGKVITQSQPVGTQVRKGTTIRLTVGKAIATTTTTTASTTTTRPAATTK
jgi:serine/threonine-protein kinase